MRPFPGKMREGPARTKENHPHRQSGSTGDEGGLSGGTAAEAAAKTRTAFPRRAKEPTAPGPYRETAHDEDTGRLRAEAGHISGGTVFRTVPGLKVPGGRPPGW